MALLLDPRNFVSEGDFQEWPIEVSDSDDDMPDEVRNAPFPALPAPAAPPAPPSPGPMSQPPSPHYDPNTPPTSPLYQPSSSPLLAQDPWAFPDSPSYASDSPASPPDSPTSPPDSPAYVPKVDIPPLTLPPRRSARIANRN